MEFLYSPEAWAALLALTALEIVLGIDNVIFISILVARLPAHQQDKGRIFGLFLAMVARILLLLSIFWIMKLTAPLFTILGNEISGRDLILLIGGLFLIFKSVHEIHASFDDHDPHSKAAPKASFVAVLVQITLLDVVFSMDSVITAVGMAKDIEVMIAAVIIAILVMMAASKSINDFVTSHPTIKMLALAFLILVGMTLMAEGLAFHIPKGYIYFAMAFAFGVEMLNIRLRKKKLAKNKKGSS